jgi:hypothetical protein
MSNTAPTPGGTLAQTLAFFMDMSVDRLLDDDLERLSCQRDEAHRVVGELANMAERMSSRLWNDAPPESLGLHALAALARHAEALLLVAQLADEELSMRAANQGASA